MALAISTTLTSCGLAPGSAATSDEIGTGPTVDSDRIESSALEANDEAIGATTGETLPPATTPTAPPSTGADSIGAVTPGQADIESDTAEPTDTTAPEAEPATLGTIVAHATSDEVVARVAADPSAAEIEAFAHPTDRGGPLVFQALGAPSGGWIEVLLPIRPNGSTGWIRLDDVELTRNPYRIEVDVDAYQLSVIRDGEVTLVAEVALGLGDTPTPIGDFYLIELLQPPDPNGPYGTYAYGLSGYSEVLDSFNGGDGIVGIHGTNEPDLLGGPASHGCIRVHNDVIEQLASFLPLGTPVSITGELPEL